MPYCFNDIFVRQRDRQTKVFARRFSFSGKIRLVCSWQLIRFEEGVPLLWRKPFFTIKRASLRYEETPPLSANSSFHSPLYSERGWGWGFFSPAPVRYSSPWGRLGGVIPFGEGTGERLLLPLKELPPVGTDALVWKPLPASPEGRNA